VAGSYTVGATFDGVTTAVARGSGTLTLVQPNDGSTLTGTADMSLRLNGQDFAVLLGVSQASVTEAGVVSFVIGIGSWTWAFTGTVNGASRSGRHEISTSPGPVDGPWSATRTAGPRARP
jgi:hypothetical protein